MNGSMSSNEACAHENMIHDQKRKKYQLFPIHYIGVQFCIQVVLLFIDIVTILFIHRKKGTRRFIVADDNTMTQEKNRI